MTRFEALNIINENLAQIEVKATQTNIRSISIIGNLVSALIDIENKEMKKAEEQMKEHPEEEQAEEE